MEYADGGDAQKKIDASIKNKSLIPESTIWKMLCHIVLGNQNYPIVKRSKLSTH
jgi:hypothetical protein